MKKKERKLIGLIVHIVCIYSNRLLDTLKHIHTMQAAILQFTSL